MKKYRLTAVAVIAAFVLTACATIPYKETRYIVDYRPYLAEGFKISPTDLIGCPYDYLAEIAIEVRPGTTKTYAVNGEVIASEKHDGGNTNDLLKNFVICAKELGADGIVNLRSERIYESGLYIITISGWAVKTRDK